ncbi:mCG1035888 [Mus musculus]|nr:mCG1035888 [Mus musculus]
MWCTIPGLWCQRCGLLLPWSTISMGLETIQVDL